MQHQFNNVLSGGTNAAFMRNNRGEICIAFSDPVYAQAQAIVIDAEERAVHAILHNSAYFIGNVSETMAEAFAGSTQALLAAVRPDGSVLEAYAPVQAGRA